MIWTAPIQNGTSGGRHERTDSVVISEQETKMEGIQHVTNGRIRITMQLWSVKIEGAHVNR